MDKTKEQLQEELELLKKQRDLALKHKEEQDEVRRLKQEIKYIKKGKLSNNTNKICGSLFRSFSRIGSSLKELFVWLSTPKQGYTSNSNVQFGERGWGY